MQAYCVKCREKREMKNPKSITMKNGKPATQGVCPTCGTKMFRIGKPSQCPSINRYMETSEYDSISESFLEGWTFARGMFCLFLKWDQAKPSN